MNFAQTIRRLRDNANLTQQDAAKAAGIARVTYVGLENNRRDPNLSEIKRLAEFYQIDPADLISGKVQTDTIVIPHQFEDSNTTTARDTKPEFKPEKLREVLLYTLGKVGAKHNVGETVLYKLLYFIDFDYYEKTGQSITGLTYVRNHFGPTPAIDFVRAIEGMKGKELEIVETPYYKNKQKKYLPIVAAKLNNLSADELRHIDQTLNRLSDKSAKELTALSHLDTPWRVAKQGKPIEYRFVYYRSDLTAVTEPEDEL